MDENFDWESVEKALDQAAADAERRPEPLSAAFMRRLQARQLRALERIAQSLEDLVGALEFDRMGGEESAE